MFLKKFSGRQPLDGGVRQIYLGSSGEAALCPSSCLPLAKMAGICTLLGI